jgi:hypothetical protein
MAPIRSGSIPRTFRCRPRMKRLAKLSQRLDSLAEAVEDAPDIVEVVRREINPDRAAIYARMKKAEVVEHATAALDGKWLLEPLIRSDRAAEAADDASVDDAGECVEDEAMEDA